MDLGKAFSFVLDDEQWLVVILVGGLLLLIPIIGQLLLIGFVIETARNVAAGSPRPLPKWDRFGEKLGSGFGGFVVQLVYALPAVVPAMLLACVGVAAALAAPDEETIGAMIGLTSLCLVPLTILVTLVLQPFMLAGLARYIQTGSVGAGLSFGEVLRLVRADIGSWMVLFLLYLLCSFVASLGSIVLVIGALFTTMYAQAVFGHLLGQQIARMSQAYGGEYAPPASPYSA